MCDPLLELKKVIHKHPRAGIFFRKKGDDEMMSGLSQKNFLKANMAVAVAGLFVAGIGVKMAVAASATSVSTETRGRVWLLKISRQR